ncbi:hypothetical protein PHISCL_03167 [Aspergillus sclerotialis]|uniref:Uncharacterized protein n=1 Tax=Aspergillus sclerotialis TaxID=2070753 RepID=A0A3A3A371_9EURO|nr:hypothetical protein PHISCL_03167 [Aspergillus sclerotialis]
MKNTHRSPQASAAWRIKRQTRGYIDPRKRAKADRERFRRGKRGSYKRLNDLFLDGLETGRERRVYALVMTVIKGRHAAVRYSTYNSHPNEDWVPPVDDVTEHWPKTDVWTPKDFEEGQTTRHRKDGDSSTKRLFTVSKPPSLDLDQLKLVSVR